MTDEPIGEITRYVSPDGLLISLVIRYPDDVALGFYGAPWHTHGDILALLFEASEDKPYSVTSMRC